MSEPTVPVLLSHEQISLCLDGVEAIQTLRGRPGDHLKASSEYLRWSSSPVELSKCVPLILLLIRARNVLMGPPTEEPNDA